MSRAFTKENDTDAVGDYPERPIPDDRNLVTRRGFALIEMEIRTLQDALAKAQNDDDRNRRARLARDLRYWLARHGSAEIVPMPPDDKQVYFGSKITLAYADGRQKTFRIVGQDEADPAQGLLSYTAPVALVLMGKEIGDAVQVGPATAEITLIEIN